MDRGPLRVQGRVQWVIVGADRIAANGDVANKIGTYSTALAARYHGLRFMVVAPTATAADALSTAFMVLALPDIERYCRDHPDVSATIVTRDHGISKIGARTKTAK